MIRSRSFALVDTESKVSACTHMPIVRYEDARFSKRDDSVIQEAELTVFVNGARQCDTTCSPWDVRELVAGNLFLAGVVTDPEQVSAIDVDLDSGAVSVRVDVAGASRRRRRHVETLRDGGVVISGVFERGDGGDPSCDAEGFLPVESDLTLQAAQVVERMALLEDRSLLFRRTGGVHSAVLVDQCGVVAWFEDIGRHSALDKLVGWCFLNGVDASDKMLLFSGRVPREIIVKVIRLGCPVVASPGAPTSLSMRLAQRWGVTLVGFAKRDVFNVYAHPKRIV